MKKLQWISFLFTLAFPMGLMAQDSSHILIIEISDIRTSKGQIIIDLYESEATYAMEMPVYKFKIPKTDVKKEKLSFKVKLPPGTYAIAIVDDENLDNKINRNLFGYPLEGFGFSMYDSFPLRKPDFNKICFELNEKIQHLSIKLLH